MATISASDPTGDARSGGKILTKKRRRTANAPYDRPHQSQSQRQATPQGSPNWLTGVIFPATRMIASGAVKMISSVFDSSSSSSTSSSSSESENQPENDVTDDAHDDDTAGVNHPNKERMISSEGRNFANKEPQPRLLNSVTKSAITRLLMQERFSRQERDRLVQIIDSRVIDPIVGGEADVMLVDIPVGSARYDSSDLCTKAVMEARKWLEEKKVGSSPSSDLAHESHTLTTVAIQHFENETGSPVDVAKSYMKSRPPWASPLAEHTDLQTPFTLTRELFKEGTSASFDGGLLSSLKKRSSIASGSWNIEDELRRVRSKASEDMLSSLPSTNIDMLSFQTTHKSGKDAVLADFPVCGEMEGNKSNLVTNILPIDVTRAMAAGLSSSLGVSAAEMRQDDVEEDTLKTHSALLVSEELQTKDLEAVKVTGERAGSMSETSAHLGIYAEPCDDPRSSQRKEVPQVEGVIESETTRVINGLHTSQARSYSGEMHTGDVHRQPHDSNPGPVGIDTETTNSIQVEDTPELLGEASVQVPIVDETNGIVDVSQSVSSVPLEETPLEPTQLNSNKMVGGDDGVSLKQEVKKPTKYNRRSRARGK